MPEDETLLALKYAVSILESMPDEMLETLQNDILGEDIDWKYFVDNGASSEQVGTFTSRTFV